MQFHIYNEWTWDKCLKTFCNKLLTNDLQEELLPEWLLHMSLERRYSSKSISLWTNYEKRKRQNFSNKYETADYSLSWQQPIFVVVGAHGVGGNYVKSDWFGILYCNSGRA